MRRHHNHHHMRRWIDIYNDYENMIELKKN